MPTAYGVSPEPIELLTSPDGQSIIVRTPYYEVEHSLDHGGAISAIRLLRVSDENLLLGPCGMELVLESPARAFTPGPQPEVETSRTDTETRLSFCCPLRDADGNDCGAVLRTSYVHRWGHVKIRQELRVPTDGLVVKRLLLHSWSVIPALTHFGVRPGAPAEASPFPGAFGVCQWGRFSPGRAFDSAYESRYVPRYVCFAEPGRRGLEWFVGSELAQWDYQVAGEPGHASLHISSRPSPPAVALGICALDLPMGSLRMAGTYVFDSYIGIPIISGRAHAPFLHRSFRRKHWPSEELIESWAARGVRTAHFHHDGDTFRDGLFWRDGSYPPFGPEDMAEFDRVIATCHRHGIRVATYFSNKELHPTVQAYKDHGPQWARLPNDRRQQIHNYYSGDEYGAQMCLRSGWLDFFKDYVDTVLSHHDLDGTYYDWNVALYCHNEHVSGGGQDASGPHEGGMGAQAASPVGHWDVDELLDLMQWTRQRVGAQGLVIVHNTMVPMAATENFADYVVAMEWGYSQLSLGAPELAQLPLEWSFMGARSRGVIGYGCLAPNAPERVHRQLTLRCLLTGVAPWPALDLDLEMFAPLAGRDLTDYVFHDWRNRAAHVSAPDAATALYCKADHALLLIGELSGHARTVRCTLDPDKMGLRGAASYRLCHAGESATLSAADLERTGIELAVPADDLAVVEIQPAV